MKVFYARVSTEEQHEARQIETAKEKNCERIFLDKASGKNTDRPELKKMIEFVREGDVVIVSDISRLGRNTADLLKITDELTKKKVDFVSTKEAIDTRTPTGRFMLTVFSALAELERANILERQKEGIVQAKKAGKYKGRKPMSIDRKRFDAICKRWRNGEITAVAVQKEFNMTATTFYKKVKAWGL